MDVAKKSSLIKLQLEVLIFETWPTEGCEVTKQKERCLKTKKFKIEKHINESTTVLQVSKLSSKIDQQTQISDK